MPKKLDLTMGVRAGAIEAKVMNKIREARVALNWSEGDLANAAGITLASVHAMASGQGSVQPLIAVMNVLCRELSPDIEFSFLHFKNHTLLMKKLIFLFFHFFLLFHLIQYLKLHFKPSQPTITTNHYTSFHNKQLTKTPTNR